MRICLLVFIIAFSLLTVSSCDKKDVPVMTKPVYDTSLVVLSGNNQVVIAQARADTMRVKVTDERGEPVPNVTVTYEQITPDEGGQFPAPSWAIQTTDANGVAFTAFYQVDTLVGIDTIRATASGVTDSVVYFVYEVVPYPDTLLYFSIVSGNAQIVKAGEALDNPCVVRVADKFGNIVPNHKVRFIAEDRCLVATDSSTNPLVESDTAFTRTDGLGLASADWTLTVNPIPGLDIYPNVSLLKALNENNDSLDFSATTIDPSPIEYYNDIRAIFEDNCFLCHTAPPASGTNYLNDTYSGTVSNRKVLPGDSTSPLLSYAIASHKATQINIIEEDKVRQWIIQDDALPGPVNYDDELAVLMINKCGVGGLCHAPPFLGGNPYSTETYSDILDTGLDAIPNAIAGDSNSLLVQKLLPLGTMYPHLLPDTALLPKLIIKWVVEDLLREN